MEPFRIDVGRARRDAKALLAAARSGNPEALGRLRADRAPRLADAQHAVARSLGFASWRLLLAAQPDLGTQLRDAARTGDEDELYRLLDAGAPPNARDRAGRTALHVAAAADQLDTVSALVGWVPVDVAATDRRGHTALDLAEPSSPVAAVLASCGLGPRRPAAGSAHAELAIQAEVALLEHLSRAPGVDREIVGDGFAFRSGLFDNSRNAVVCSHLANVDEVGRIVAAMASVPACWHVGADADPALRHRLEQAGGRPERSAVHMAARLDQLDAAPNAQVRKVRAAEDLVHLDGDAARLFAAVGPPLRHFVVGGVAGITTFISNRVVLGVELRVDAPARRRGLARTLLRHALHAATSDGCTHAVLAPTPATVPFYERLGFGLERSLADRCYYLPLALDG